MIPLFFMVLMAATIPSLPAKPTGQSQSASQEWGDLCSRVPPVEVPPAAALSSPLPSALIGTPPGLTPT